MSESNNRYVPKPQGDETPEPFESIEQAWFWFIQAQQARNDGARVTRGLGLTVRPCEPVDILRALDRLYRNRVVQRDHLLVLRHYGRRQMAPDARRVKEMRAALLWGQALDRLRGVLEQKGIVRARDFYHNIIPFPEAAE